MNNFEVFPLPQDFPPAPELPPPAVAPPAPTLPPPPAGVKLNVGTSETSGPQPIPLPVEPFDPQKQAETNNNTTAQQGAAPPDANFGRPYIWKYT